jgi:hypothetical protein
VSQQTELYGRPVQDSSWAWSSVSGLIGSFRSLIIIIFEMPFIHSLLRCLIENVASECLISTDFKHLTLLHSAHCIYYSTQHPLAPVL